MDNGPSEPPASWASAPIPEELGKEAAPAGGSMGRWLALAAAAAAWPLRGDTRRRRLEDEYDAYVAEHGDDIEDRKPGYYGLRRVADMGYLEVARRLFDGAGATCMLSGGGAVPYFQSCTGCALADALQCVADMRANVSLNVPVGCDLGAVASQPDRGTAYSEPWIEDSFEQTWPHARRDPETLEPGTDPVIRRYPREGEDGTGNRYRTVPDTAPQVDRLRGDGVALGGAPAYQGADAGKQDEANLLLAAEWQRQFDNRRCCAVWGWRNTYAYPDTLRCLEETGCKNTKVYAELLDECEMACGCPMDVYGWMKKHFRHPIGAPENALGTGGQPGRSPDEPTSHYTACGGVGMARIWEKTCQATVWDQNAGAGLAPGLAAGLAAAVASVRVYY